MRYLIIGAMVLFGGFGTVDAWSSYTADGWITDRVKGVAPSQAHADLFPDIKC